MSHTSTTEKSELSSPATHKKSKTELPDSAHSLYLIDVSSFIFRAFFAIRALKSHSGEPTNAVYGVATMLARISDQAKPQFLSVIYDSPESSFREEIYPEYKANRSEAPDDLKPQFSRIEEMIRCFEIQSYRQSGVEADDLIATLTRRWCDASPKNHVVIVSSDKDLMQLVNERVCVWDTMSNQIYGIAEVEEKFSIAPGQIRDYLALVGDSSDNIPGVAGIGPKGASELLRQYGTLGAVLDAAQSGAIGGKKGESLKTGKVDALLSADLATLRSNLEVSLSEELVRYRFHLTEACENLFKELSFHALAQKWKLERGPTPESEVRQGLTGRSSQEEVEGRFRTVNTEKDFQLLIECLKKSTEFGFDLETTSLNPRVAKIVGVAVCYDSEFGCYIPLGHDDSTVPQLSRTRVFDALTPLLESEEIKKIGQNLKFDWSILRENAVNPRGIGFDTMVAAYLLDPSGRHNLKGLAEQYLGYQVQTYEEVCGKGKDQLTFDQIKIADATRYSAEDAWVAVRLWHQLREFLDREELSGVFYGVDLPLVQVLSKMELQGVEIDVAYLEVLSQEFEKDLATIEEKIQAHTKSPINLHSPKQIAKLLFDDLKLPTQSKTKTGFSTDATVLDALSSLHEVPRLLLEYREISKLKGTYVDPLPGLRDPKTQKIHASFNQTITATGRLSSSDPNLQNIPVRSERGARIRRAFIPSVGNLLVSADYSQIELRLLAHMSGDPELVNSFQKGEDVHRRTAGEIFGISADQVDDHQRGIAKAINFGLMYGKTAFGLSQELKISRKDAKDMIDRYFERYRGVKIFLDAQVESAREKGYVTSYLGRKRKLPEIHSKNAAIRSNAERMAMNTPIQATAADLMKLAMIEIDRRIESEGYRSRLTIQVHDEVVLDCPRDEVEAVKKWVPEVMEGAMKLSVPLLVNVSSGENWMEL